MSETALYLPMSLTGAAFTFDIQKVDSIAVSVFVVILVEFDKY